MTGFDFAVMGIVLISFALGLWRGLVYEVLSLLGWPVAFVLSKRYAANIADLMPGMQEALRITLAYAVVFIGALILWGVLAWLISKLVKAVGLGWLDRVLGSLFGIVRAMLVILVLVWLAGLSNIPEHPLWHDAQSSKAAEDAALLTKVWLPENIARRIHYRSRS